MRLECDEFLGVMGSPSPPPNSPEILPWNVPEHYMPYNPLDVHLENDGGPDREVLLENAEIQMPIDNFNWLDYADVDPNVALPITNNLTLLEEEDLLEVREPVDPGNLYDAEMDAAFAAIFPNYGDIENEPLIEFDDNSTQTHWNDAEVSTQTNWNDAEAQPVMIGDPFIIGRPPVDPIFSRIFYVQWLGNRLGVYRNSAGQFHVQAMTWHINHIRPMVNSTRSRPRPASNILAVRRASNDQQVRPATNRLGVHGPSNDQQVRPVSNMLTLRRPSHDQQDRPATNRLTVHRPSHDQHARPISNLVGPRPSRDQQARPATNRLTVHRPSHDQQARPVTNLVGPRPRTNGPTLRPRRNYFRETDEDTDKENQVPRN